MQDNTTYTRESQPGRRSRKHNNLWAGIIMLTIGALLLVHKMGIYLPDWLLSWPMILIIVGFFAGAASRFRNFSWLIITGIGVFFLVDRIVPDIDFGDFVFPAIIIGVGLVVIFGSARRRRSHQETAMFSDNVNTGITDKEDELDMASVFGGIKRIVYSKQFRGGEIVNIFGGSEIDLSQADFNGRIEIEVVQVFGGTKLIVPPHWEIRTADAIAIFGGFDDKRSAQAITNPDKVVVIRGTTIFGGLDIRSY